jgi:hypothetical protein
MNEGVVVDKEEVIEGGSQMLIALISEIDGRKLLSSGLIVFQRQYPILVLARRH